MARRDGAVLHTRVELCGESRERADQRQLFREHPSYGDLQRSTDGTEQLSGLVVTGDESFEIHLSAPDSILPQKLGTVPFLPLPDSFYDDPDAYASKPVATAPTASRRGRTARISR